MFFHPFVVNFNDPATVYAHSLISVHHDAMWYIILILSIVYWSLFKIVSDYNWFTFNKHIGFFSFFFKPFFFFLDILCFFFYFFFIFFFVKSLFKYFNYLYRVLDQFVFLHNDFSFISKFYDFVKGFEHFLGYNFSYFDSFFYLNIRSLFSLFSDKYLYHLLSNWTNIAFRFYNPSINFNDNLLNVQRFHHNTIFEFVCAIFPTFIILLILIPSTLLLYSLDEEIEPLITYKVVGHQWFWSYEFNNWLQINNEWKKVAYNFDSCMVVEDDLFSGGKRLLEVDKPLFVPVNVPLRFLITSVDVLHSWALPELGIKIDAVPGRLSHYLVLIRRPGFFYGQCSELCGVAHAFMPIVLKAV